MSNTTKIIPVHYTISVRALAHTFAFKALFNKTSKKRDHRGKIHGDTRWSPYQALATTEVASLLRLSLAIHLF